MIEQFVMRFLANYGLSVGNDVYLETPKDPPDKYIVLEKTGGGETDKVQRATIAIQSRCKSSLFGAAMLDQEVKDAMSELWMEPEIFSCKLNSDYNFTNSEAKEYRYQAVFNITY